MADTFGTFLRERRAAKGSQSTIAEQLHHVQIPQSRLSEMEAARLIPDRAQEAAIADVLGFTTAERAEWSRLIVQAETERRAAKASA